MDHRQKYFRQEYPGPDGSENNLLRLFIRRNRKKILIFLGVGVILLLAILVIVGMFLFSVVLPAGTEAINKSVGSGETQGMFAGLINWLVQFVRNINPMQLLNLILQSS